MMKKITTRRPGPILLAGALLIVLFAEVASAHGRRGGGRRTVIAPRVSPVFYGGFYGGIYGRPYLSPFWAGYPYFYEPYRSIGDRMNPALAQALDVGALDLDIKPRKSAVVGDNRQAPEHTLSDNHSVERVPMFVLHRSRQQRVIQCYRQRSNPGTL